MVVKNAADLFAQRSPQSKTDTIKVSCYYCSYVFAYNVEKGTPKLCPNCGEKTEA